MPLVEAQFYWLKSRQKTDEKPDQILILINKNRDRKFTQSGAGRENNVRKIAAHRLIKPDCIWLDETI